MPIKKGTIFQPALYHRLMGTKFILLFVLHIKLVLYYYGPVQEPMGSCPVTCMFFIAEEYDRCFV